MYFMKKKLKIDPYILPSNNDEMRKFITKFKVDMMKNVVLSIEFAAKNNLPLVEVFQFKNSDFVITIGEKDYISNVDNIFNYFIENELYENCDKIVKLQSILKKRKLK